MVGKAMMRNQILICLLAGMVITEKINATNDSIQTIATELAPIAAPVVVAAAPLVSPVIVPALSILGIGCLAKYSWNALRDSWKMSEDAQFILREGIYYLATKKSGSFNYELEPLAIEKPSIEESFWLNRHSPTVAELCSLLNEPLVIKEEILCLRDEILRK